MKRVIPYLVLFLLSGAVFSQNKYNNEWIDFSKSYFKIKIGKEGIYRISQSVLASAGVPSNINGNQFRLIRNGVAVPFFVSAQSVLGTSDFIEFFGEQNDGKPDNKLFQDSSWQLQNYRSMFTDTAVYFLTWDATPNSDTVTNYSNDLSSPPSEEPYCIYTARNYPYNPQGGIPDLGGLDFFSSEFGVGEGIARYGEWDFRCPFDMSVKEDNEQIYTPQKITSGNATLKTTVFGFTKDLSSYSALGRQCYFSLKLNNNALITDSLMTGAVVNRFTLSSIPVSQINSPMSTLTFSAYAANPESYSLSWSFVEIEYPRLMNLDGYITMRFSIPANGSKRYLKFSNFGNNAQQYFIYDLKNKQRVDGTIDVDGFLKFVLPAPLSAVENRELFLSQDIISVAQITPVTFVNYALSQNQGNYLIVSHKKLFVDPNNTSINPVNEYSDYRKSVAGGNYSPLILDIEQLYDQFSFGIEKHPLSIYNFIKYALDNFTVVPEYLFLLGKGYDYVKRNDNPPMYFSNGLVPPFGNPASDYLFATDFGRYSPKLAIGRLSANTGEDVMNYLNKIKAFDANINTIQNNATENSPAVKGFMKNILHLGGGKDAFEQGLFKALLQKYESFIEDSSFGGNVYSFFKSSNDPIQAAPSKFIDSLINSGLSIMNFFGHSAANTFDNSIDDPDYYNNQGKYFLLISNGCYSGQMYDFGLENNSEKFVLIKDKGAIAYLSATTEGVPPALDAINSFLYNNISKNMFGQTVGKCLQNALSQIDTNFSDPIYKIVSEQDAFHGDPAISFQFNPLELPDYYIDLSRVSFSPSVITARDSSFYLMLNIFNLGKASKDSIDIVVKRTMPPGQFNPAPYYFRIPAPLHETVYTITLPRAVNDTLGDDGIGQNIVEITVDGSYEKDEYAETNNTVSVPFYILSDDAFPVYPYEFSIVGYDTVTLNASTADFYAPVARNYRIEIDTMEGAFNSSMKRSFLISSKGGVLQWVPKNSGFNFKGFKDSTVFYWRVSLDTSSTTSGFNWKNSSFIYIDNSPKGWNQSHYYQFKKDNYSNITLDATRTFDFIKFPKSIGVRDFVPSYGGDYTNLRLFENGFQRKRGSCLVYGFYEEPFSPNSFPTYSGINIALFDSATGQLIPQADSLNGYKMSDFWDAFVPCGGGEGTWDFRFASEDTSSTDGTPNYDSLAKFQFIKFLNEVVPGGTYIVGYIFHYNGDVVDYTPYMPDLMQTFKDFGINNIQSAMPSTFTLVRPYVFFAQKGHPQNTVEIIGNDIYSIIDTDFVIPQIWNQGKITSTKIGPASNWGSLHWRHGGKDTTAETAKLWVYGIDKNGKETQLFQYETIFDVAFNPTMIDANVYPYMRLELEEADDYNKTATQLRYWRVLYDELPEAALNANANFIFLKDTLLQGETLDVSIAMQNIGKVNMDSMLVRYIITKPNGTKIISDSLFKPLLINDVSNATFQLKVKEADFRGRNQLFIDMNPDNNQPEQFHFNNIAYKNFWVEGDFYNPLMDVTFDGYHIMDGDIVSARPNILIKLKDENKYLALDSASDFKISLSDPDKANIPLAFDNKVMRFTPASSASSDNTAMVEINPVLLKDGKYQLVVSATDKAGNQAGRLDYKVSFEVINKSMVTNVLNYPNPFTTSTRFVFTLTGYQIPTFFKIQILTITGKVVREITLNELGPLHIGRNETQFAWDGRDMYGDNLANGLYLYRIVVSIDGKKVEHYEKEAIDKYFKSGFGKMYLVR